MNYHGGNIYDKNKNLVDFSSNINPLGIPESFQKALFCHIDVFTKYPDINYNRLKQSIGNYINTDSSNIIVGNGAVNIIYHLAKCFPVSKAVIAVPTFSEYKRAMETAGIEVVEKEIFDFDKMTFDLSILEKEIERDAVYIVCNPNNPTGSLLEQDKMQNFAQILEQFHSFLLVDEAFMDFVFEPQKYSVLKFLKEHQNVVVVRAATKFFGMPGIRLGYGVTTNKELFNKIEKLAEPWNINAAAELAGSVIFQDRDYIAKTKKWIEEERCHMGQLLKEINGLFIFPTAANFYLVQIENRKIYVELVYKKMIQKGYLIRTPNGFIGLDKQFFRVAIKGRQDNINFCKALKKVMTNLLEDCK